MKTSEFLTDLKLLMAEPDFSDREILRVATMQLRNRLYPHLMKLNDGYYTREETLTIKTGSDRIDMPVDGLSDSYVDVKVKVGERYELLTKVQPSQVDGDGTGKPKAFYLMGREMVFDRKADRDYEVRFIYQYLPPDLVEERAAPMCTSKTDGSNLPRINTDPFTYADLVSSGTERTYATLWRSDGSHERVATIPNPNAYENPSSSQFRFTQAVYDEYIKDIPDEVVETCCISFGMGSRFVAVPNTYRLLLMHLTAAAMMRTIGDYEAAQVHQGEVDLLTQSSSVKGRQGQNHRLIRNVWY